MLMLARENSSGENGPAAALLRNSEHVALPSALPPFTGGHTKRFMITVVYS